MYPPVSDQKTDVTSHNENASFKWHHSGRRSTLTGLKESTSTSNIASLLIDEDDDGIDSSKAPISPKRVQSSALLNTTTTTTATTIIATDSSANSCSSSVNLSGQVHNEREEFLTSSSSSSLKPEKTNEFEAVFKRDHPWQSLFVAENVDKSIEEVLNEYLQCFRPSDMNLIHPFLR